MARHRRAAPNPDYVLRGLLRCGLCGEAMCPGSTTKNGKVYRFYRCSKRDKHGKEVRVPPHRDHRFRRIVITDSGIMIAPSAWS